MVNFKCFQITRLQTVVKLNVTKLKISSKYNNILNITLKKTKYKLHDNYKKLQKLNGKNLG